MAQPSNPPPPPTAADKIPEPPVPFRRRQFGGQQETQALEVAKRLIFDLLDRFEVRDDDDRATEQAAVDFLEQHGVDPINGPPE